MLQVGMAQRDITPQEPVPMWGYGARHDALSVGVRDPLLATAIVIEAGRTKLAIVSLDLGRSPSENSLQKIRARIKGEAGIQHSFIAGSHSHHGPVLELSNEEGKGKGKFDGALRYYEHLESAISDAIIEANNKLNPATVAVGSVELIGFNRNRHTKIEPKPVDRKLRIMRFDDMSGKMQALLVNFSAHPTMLEAGDLRFSADYVGALRNHIRERLGVSTVFMQGAGGDLSTDKGSRPDHIAYGKALGREVVKLASNLVPLENPNPWIDVREQRFTFESRTDLTNPLIRAAYSLAFFPELIPNFADEYVEGIRPRLTVAVLNGEIAIVGASGEFFCNHSLRLADRARVNELFFFGYCNGYHQYFPTIEAVAEGGYGADARVAPAEVGAGEKLMNTALTWIYEMQGRIR